MPGNGRSISGKNFQGMSNTIPPTSDHQTCISNKEMDTKFLPCISLGKRISATKINDALKAMTAKGKSLCLHNDGQQKFYTWHSKGFYYSGCSHQIDHEKCSRAEMNRFYDWCKEAFVK